MPATLPEKKTNPLAEGGQKTTNIAPEVRVPRFDSYAALPNETADQVRTRPTWNWKPFLRSVKKLKQELLSYGDPLPEPHFTLACLALDLPDHPYLSFAISIHERAVRAVLHECNEFGSFCLAMQPVLLGLSEIIGNSGLTFRHGRWHVGLQHRRMLSGLSHLESAPPLAAILIWDITADMVPLWMEKGPEKAEAIA